jgi:hypothetical protein
VLEGYVNLRSRVKGYVQARQAVNTSGCLCRGRGGHGSLVATGESGTHAFRVASFVSSTSANQVSTLASFSVS